MGIDKDDSNQWSSDFPQEYPHNTGTSSSAGMIDSGDPFATSGYSDDAIKPGEREQYNSFGEKNQDYLYGSDDPASNSAKSLKMKNQKSWERDPSLGFSTSVYCCIVFSVNAGQGLLIGGLLGGIKAYADIQHGSGPTIRRHGVPRTILKAGALSGIQFGIWLGTYQTSKYLIKKARGIDDMGNSFGAGFIAGFVRGIQTRSPKTMMYSGVMSGVIMTILDHLPEYIQSQAKPIH